MPSNTGTYSVLGVKSKNIITMSCSTKGESLFFSKMTTNVNYNIISNVTQYKNCSHTHLIKATLGCVFCHMGAVEHALLLRLLVKQLVNSFLFIHHRATLAFILDCVSSHLTNVNQIFTFLSALFWSLIPEGNIWLFSSNRLYYVHQLVANFVCLPFGASV